MRTRFTSFFPRAAMALLVMLFSMTAQTAWAESNIVTQDNFNNFFNEDGTLKDAVTFDELIFQGEFTDLVSYIVLDSPITITGDDAVLNNMGFVIASENVTLDKMTLTATTSLGSLITVMESNVKITNLDISYIVGDEEAIAIDVRDVGGTLSDINILKNNIYFESHVSDDERYATAINLEDVEDVIVDGNIISASVPALYVNTYDWNYFMMGLVYVNPIRLYEATGLEFTNNKVDVTVNYCAASYPTAQAMYIVGSDGVLIQGNDFTMTDTKTPVGTSMYLYAVECGYSDGIEFINNNFDISTTSGQSGAGSVYVLQVATSEASFIGNNITSESNGPIVGIFSPYGFGRAKDLIIKENVLNITGLAAGSGDFALISGIEIQTGYATISNNTINVHNKGGYDDTYPVSGISAIQYSASTLSFDIQDNVIDVPDGKYAVDIRYAPQNATVIGNVLYAHEFTGNDAVYIKSGDNNTVENNLPPLTANLADGNYWTTFYCGNASYKIDEGENATAYTAEVNGETITLHSLGKDIPKNTAVIIKGEDNKISMTKCEDPDLVIPTNDLHGVDVQTTTAEIKTSLGDGTFYVLGNTNSHFGFHKYTGETMPARKVFLLLDGDTALSLNMEIDDETTGLKSIDNGQLIIDNYYDLSGRRVMNPTKGLYIVNGKKVIIK